MPAPDDGIGIGTPLEAPAGVLGAGNPDEDGCSSELVNSGPSFGFDEQLVDVDRRRDLGGPAQVRLALLDAVAEDRCV